MIDKAIIPMKITLTGAAGGLGFHVAHALVAAGHTVRGIDQSMRRDSPVPLEIVNLLDRNACYGLLQDADAVVHLANHSNEFLRDKQRLLSENLTMNTNVFQAACELGIKKVVFASSIQAIGAGKKNEDGRKPTIAYLPIDGDLPAQPTNVYGLSKQLSEEMLRYYSREAGMNCFALRFPWLVESEPEIQHFTKHYGQNTKQINEAWSYLSMADASQLIVAILNSEVEGFRIYCPVARTNRAGHPTTTLLERHYTEVPLKRQLGDSDGFFDLSRITEDTGWVPKDEWKFG